MKINGSLRGAFNCLSEADSLQPGSGNYANVTWKCRNGDPKMILCFLTAGD